MSAHLVPILSLLLSFLATLSTIRFIFSRQGFFWIIPLVVSLVLCVNNLYLLLNPTLAFLNAPFSLTLLPLVLSLFYYAVVITFHYALKKSIEKNKHNSDLKKNINEAEFLEKIERRQFIKLLKRKRDKKENEAYVPKLKNMPKESDNLFD